MNMIKKFKRADRLAVIVGLLIGVFIATLHHFTEQKAEAQTNTLQQDVDKTLGNFTLKSVTLKPAVLENPSNTFNVFDTTGTNFLQISPTNNQFIVRFLGTNSYALLSTNFVITNTAGTPHTISVIDGLIVNYQ